MGIIWEEYDKHMGITWEENGNGNNMGRTWE